MPPLRLCCAGTAEVSAAEPLPAAQQEQHRTQTFNLSTHEGFVSFWAQLQYTVVTHTQARTTGGAGRGRLAPDHPLRNCFPFDRAPEVS